MSASYIENALAQFIADADASLRTAAPEQGKAIARKLAIEAGQLPKLAHFDHRRIKTLLARRIAAALECPTEDARQIVFTGVTEGRNALQRNGSIFANHAAGLIAHGYSPIPRVIRDSQGRPGVKAWSNFCERQPAAEELEQWERIAGADIALACGFGGLLAIDVDTDAPEILDAVRRALPHCTVARRGSKGFALLCRHADGPQYTANIYSADESRKSPLIEIMGIGRNITIPPSRHAKTGRLYQGIDPANLEPRGADWQLPPLDKLPVVTNEDLERLRAELEPWSRKPKPPRPLADGPAPVLNTATEKRYRAYALAGLKSATGELAGLREGRPTELFRAVCALGWVVAHGILNKAEFTAAFVQACDRNGLAARDGRPAVEASIRSGLDCAANDPLRPLPDRENASFNGKRRSQNTSSAEFGEEGPQPGREPPKGEEVPRDGELPPGFFTDTGDVLEAPRWRVKRTIPEHGTGLLIGQSGSGKTTLATYLSICTAAGISFFDREIKRHCGVIYLAAEGGGQIAHRMRAAKIHLQISKALPLAWLKSAGDLSEVKDLDSFIKRLKAADAWLQKRFNAQCGLIIIDTAIQAFTIENEDDNAKIAEICKRLANIANALDCFVLAVVHAGKDQSRGARGGSAWRDNVDIALFAVASRNEIEGTCKDHALMLTKNRDGPEGPIGGYDLEEIELGKDTDDEAFCAAAIKPNGITPRTARAKFKSFGRRVFDASFNDISSATRGGEDHRVKGDGPLVKALRVSLVRDEFFKRYVAGEDRGEKNKDAARMAFRRALQSAGAEYYFETDADGIEWIWRLDHDR